MSDGDEKKIIISNEKLMSILYEEDEWYSIHQKNTKSYDLEAMKETIIYTIKENRTGFYWQFELLQTEHDCPSDYGDVEAYRVKLVEKTVKVFERV